MADFLSMLGASGGNTNTNLFGMTPDQQTQYDAMKHQAATQALLPALFALGLGFLGHKRAINGLREGLAGAGNAYQSSYQNNLNQNFNLAKLAEQQRRQDVMDATSVARANADIQNANTNQQKLADSEAENVPVGKDWAEQYRSDPKYKNILFPPAEEAAKYTPKQITSFWSGAAPRQQNQAAQITIRQELANQGEQRVQQGQERVNQGQQKLEQGQERNDALYKPIGYDPFEQTRKMYPQLAALLPSSDESKRLTQPQLNSWRDKLSGNSLKVLTDPTIQHHWSSQEQADGTTTLFDVQYDKSGNYVKTVPLLSGVAKGANKVTSTITYKNNPDGTKSAYNLRRNPRGDVIGVDLIPELTGSARAQNPTARIESKKLPDGTETKFLVRMGPDKHILDVTPIEQLSGGVAHYSNSGKTENPLDAATKLQKLWMMKYPMAAWGSDSDPSHSLSEFAKLYGRDENGRPLPGAVTMPITPAPAVPNPAASPAPAAASSPAPATLTPSPAAATPTAAPTAQSTPAPAAKATVSLPPTISTTSAAVDYLTKTYGMSRADAIDWIRKNQS